MKSTENRWFILFVVLLFQAVHSFSQIDVALADVLREDSFAPALVVFKQQADLSDISPHASKEQKGRSVFSKLQATARRSQSRIAAELNVRGVTFHPFHIVNAIRIPQLDANLADWLASRPEVAVLTTDPVVALQVVDQEDDKVPIGYRGNPAVGWGVESMGTPQLWGMGHTGEGVVVGGQDTGYEWDHPALRSQYRGRLPNGADHNYHWHDAIHEDIHPDDQPNPCGYSLEEPCADNPHGILTMTVAVGELPDFSMGMAPDAQWVGCRNMDRGYGSPSTYLECFEWFLAPTNVEGMYPNPDLAPHVINNSWSCPLSEGCTPANFGILELAIRNLMAAGVMVVVSAGNTGPECETIDAPPALFEHSFTVGASDIDGNVAGFSSRGLVQADGSGRFKPDVLGPGVAIPTCGYTEDIFPASGTSLSAPHLTGLVALIISARPALSGQVARLADILRESALLVTSNQDCEGSPGQEVPNAVAGYGHARAVRALELALETELEGWPIRQVVSILPNPVHNQVVIRSANRGRVHLSLYSIEGQLLLRDTWMAEQTTLHRLSMAAFAPGVYIADIQVDGQREAHKIVKW